LLAQAKELQAPRSFATGALAGLTLYLRGHKDEEVLEMLREGVKFCGLCQRDLEAYKPEAKYSFLPKGPRYYSPSEVVSRPQDIHDLKRNAESVKDTLNSILNKESLPEERIRECHHLIEGLLEPYRREAAVSLGEWKYGPTLRR
jgi:hypothetical protein